MIKIIFSEDDIARLRKIYFEHQHHVIRRRALIMILKNHEVPHHKIAKIVGVCENTVRNCLRAYQQGGIELLMTINFNKPQSKLKSFDAEIKEYFEKNPPANIAQACASIKELTGVSLKNTQIRKYLTSIGMGYRKVNGIPAKADIVPKLQCIFTHYTSTRVIHLWPLIFFPESS